MCINIIETRKGKFEEITTNISNVPESFNNDETID